MKRKRDEKEDESLEAEDKKKTLLNDGDEDVFTCNICLEKFEKIPDITHLNCDCNFYYHKDCLKKWWKSNKLKACPTCKQEKVRCRTLNNVRKKPRKE